jgi:hypothetical protein
VRFPQKRPDFRTEYTPMSHQIAAKIQGAQAETWVAFLHNILLANQLLRF